MSNLPAMTGDDTLEDLASKIKACILRVEDCRLELAKHFASAQRLCKAKGKPFKQWLTDSEIGHSYTEAVRLARIGAAKNPRKALENLRDRTKASVAKSRAVALRSATAPKLETYVSAEIDDPDVEEERTAPGQLPNRVRISGLRNRAEEAVELAKTDNMSGVTVPTEALDAVRRATEAWLTLHDHLDGAIAEHLYLEDDEPGDDDQTIWARGVSNRAMMAVGGAMYEDWSMYEVSEELVHEARAASDAWHKLAMYLQHIREGQTPRGAQISETSDYPCPPYWKES